jgi:hypothetical protein
MNKFLSTIILLFLSSSIVFCENVEPALDIVEAAKIAQDALKASEMRETHYISRLQYSHGIGPRAAQYMAYVGPKDLSLSEAKGTLKTGMITIHMDRTTSISFSEGKIEKTDEKGTRRRVVMPAKSEN